jgi:hypothetical protein
MSIETLHGNAIPPKPLYLLDGHARDIVLRDNSLEIRSETRHVHRIPLDRVDRIICGEECRWQGKALVACLQKGIQVTFHSGKGQHAGTAIPARFPKHDLHDALLIYVGNPGWRASYAEWLRQRRSAIFLHWEKGSKEGPRRSRVQIRDNWLHWVKNNTVRISGESSAEAWCASAVNQVLSSQGLALHYWADEGQSLALSEDLTHLLMGQWQLDCGTLARQQTDSKINITFFENWLRNHQKVIERHLGSLHRKVRTYGDPWQ